MAGPRAPAQCDTILQHLFNAIPDLLIVIDRDFNIVMSNWHDFEFVPEAERRGQPKCYRLYHRRDRPCEGCHVLEVFATGQPRKVEKINPIDDRIREFSIFPILDASGQVTLVVEHVRDITDRRLAEQALKESEERFRMLFDYAPDAHFLMDLQGNFLDVNRSSEEISGYDRKELIGKNFQSLPLLDDRQGPVMEELLKQAVNLAKFWDRWNTVWPVKMVDKSSWKPRACRSRLKERVCCWLLPGISRPGSGPRRSYLRIIWRYRRPPSGLSSPGICCN